MDADFIRARIEAAKTMVLAYEAAIEAIVVGGAESYMLDTGQTVQKVTKLNIDLMQKRIDTLDNRCATLTARLNGSGSLTLRPAW